MYMITINHQKGKASYPIYTKEEAEQEDIKFVNWKNTKTGEYGCSDDNMVSECYSRINYGKRDYIRFAMGVTWNNSKNFLVKDRVSIHTSNGKHREYIKTSKKGLYFIECNNMIKIGITKDIKARLKMLQVWNPYELKLVDCFDVKDPFILEKSIHHIFKNLNAKGEWFIFNEPIKKHINTLRKERRDK